MLRLSGGVSTIYGGDGGYCREAAYLNKRLHLTKPFVTRRAGHVSRQFGFAGEANVMQEADP